MGDLDILTKNCYIFTLNGCVGKIDMNVNGESYNNEFEILFSLLRASLKPHYTMVRFNYTYNIIYIIFLNVLLPHLHIVDYCYYPYYKLSFYFQF